MRRLGVCLALLCGCGYTLGPKAVHAPLPDGSLPRVAVQPFDNATYRRGLEITLTRLINDEVRARTAEAPVSVARADRVLRGSIVRVDEQVLSEDLEDRVVESSVVITVRVSIVDPPTGNAIKTYSLTETEPFSPRAGRVRNFDQAVEQALRDLAEQIVYYGLEGEGPRLNG